MSRDQRLGDRKENRQGQAKRTDVAANADRSEENERSPRSAQSNMRQDNSYESELARYRMNDLYERGSI
jgi:hypothetical protein